MTTPAAVPPRQPGLFRRALHHWKGFLVFWLIGSVFVCLWIMIDIKPVYRASSLLRVDPVVSDIYGVRGQGETHDVFMGTQVSLIVSPSVLSVAAQNPAVAGLPRMRSALDPEQELRKVVGVGGVAGTYLLEVSMTSTDPGETAIIVNAVVDAFLETNENWTDGKTKAQIKNLEIYKLDLESQTSETEKRWRELVKKSDLDEQFLVESQPGDKSPGSERPSARVRVSITTEEYKKIRQDLFQGRLDLAQAVAWLEEVKRTAKDAPQTADQAKVDQQVEDRFKVEPAVVELTAKLAEAKDMLDDVRKKATTPGGPDEQAARRSFDELTTAYHQAWESRSRIYREQIEEAHRADSELEIREADRRVRFLKVRQSALTLASEQMDVNTRRRATDQVDLTLTLEERNTLKLMQDAVRRRLEQLRFEAKSVNRVQKIDPAKVPGEPIANKRVAWLAIAPFAMLFLAFVPFLLFEAFIGPPGNPTGAKDLPVDP